MSQIFMVPGTYDENLAHVEPGDVASRNYAAGEFLTWKGVLHSAKTAISTGETFVEDTNVQDESDGGLAKALRSNFAVLEGTSPAKDVKATVAYPSGFSVSNSVIISVLCHYVNDADANSYAWVDVSRLNVSLNTDGISMIPNANYAGMAYRIGLYRYK